MEGIDKDGHLLLNRDNEKYGWLKKHASDLGLKHVHSFGENAKADFRLLNCKLFAGLLDDHRPHRRPMMSPSRSARRAGTWYRTRLR